MVSEEQVKQALEEVLIPVTMRSLAKLNLIRQVAISD